MTQIKMIDGNLQLEAVYDSDEEEQEKEREAPAQELQYFPDCKKEDYKDQNGVVISIEEIQADK